MADTFRPEVRRAAERRLDEILVERFGMDSDRVGLMGFGAKFERLLDEVERDERMGKLLDRLEDTDESAL